MQENWRIDVADRRRTARRRAFAGAAHRCGRAPADEPRSAARSCACIEAAHAAGVMVAEPIAECARSGVIGAPFAVQRLIRGMAQGRRIVRDPKLAESSVPTSRARSAASSRGSMPIRPPRDDLSFLPLPERRCRRRVQLRKCASALDKASDRAAGARIRAGLADSPTRRRRGPTTLVHGDFRTGNYMVEHRPPDRRYSTGSSAIGAIRARISAGSAPAAGASATMTLAAGGIAKPSRTCSTATTPERRHPLQPPSWPTGRSSLLPAGRRSRCCRAIASSPAASALSSWRSPASCRPRWSWTRWMPSRSLKPEAKRHDEPPCRSRCTP